MHHPPLLRLPPELHGNIMAYLEIQDLVRLARTSRYFLSIVQPPTHADFLAAETRQWAVARDLYACGGCNSFQHLRRFADYMRKGRRGRRGSEAHTRLCIKCGVERHTYTLGIEITIMGQIHVLCKVCGTFSDHPGFEGACMAHSPAFRAFREESTESGRDGHKYDSDDDWAYSTKSFACGKHADEVLGVYPDV